MMGETETQGNRFNQPIPEGANVYDVNGEKVGSVSGFNAQGGYLTIQKGWLLTHDIYVPSNTIGRVVSTQVHLNLSKDDLKDQRWTTPPSDRLETREAGMGSTEAYPAPEQGRVEPERGRMDLEQGRVEPERAGTDLGQGRMEAERAGADLEQGRVEPERGRMDLEQGRVEPERAGMNLERGQMEGARAADGREDIRLR